MLLGRRLVRDWDSEWFGNDEQANQTLKRAIRSARKI